MNFKNVLPFVIPFLTLSAAAQTKVFSFNQIQLRNNTQEWGIVQHICEEQVFFTPEQIDLNVDKDYHLRIISKTELPNNGTIFLCNDEKSNPVTVMLIDNSKMFLYSKTKRFLINFDNSIKTASNIVADTD